MIIPYLKNAIPQRCLSDDMCGVDILRCLIASSAVLAVSVSLFYDSLWASFLSVPLSVFVMRPFAVRLSEKRKLELTYQFNDALYAISASISAGRPFIKALSDARNCMVLLHGPNSRIELELMAILNKYHESKECEEKILTDFSRRCKVNEISNFTDVYLTCRKTGGDLGNIMAKSSRMIMDRIAVRREIAVLTSQKKLEGRLLAIFPFMILGGLKITSPDYLDVMYKTLQGRVLMTAALAGIVASMIMIDRISSIDV